MESVDNGLPLSTDSITILAAQSLSMLEWRYRIANYSREPGVNDIQRLTSVHSVEFLVQFRTHSLCYRPLQLFRQAVQLVRQRLSCYPGGNYRVLLVKEFGMQIPVF